jgi:hypothetical protein
MGRRKPTFEGTPPRCPRKSLGTLKEDGLSWTLWLRVGMTHGEALSVKLAAEGRSRKANFWMLWNERRAFQGRDARILAVVYPRLFKWCRARLRDFVRQARSNARTGKVFVD